MPKVRILMGSKSDAEIGKNAKALLDELGVDADMVVASAHRTPERVERLVKKSDADVFIAIAGLSAALPGVVASFTIKPVIGVPVSGKLGLDSILSVVQMPPGIPVAAVGLDRGENAALLAAEIIAIGDPSVAESLLAYRKNMAEKVIADSEELC
ncbi:MAG: 5-(carboxyamino)imidazole ribonucleotide mutase [Candidatus Methanomethylophilaceae archaeon]|nr:5-(carboxyamino)imidazole ribonucleotide mutase [Candidatus Methanomethylophilaceae archaeon]HIJ00991.1 5-(carboxyamino)imidazole ribonucleotide mutase [Candidatus Methanomethylophilaceae archaeon]